MKYFGKESTRTPGTLHAISPLVLNHLAKLTTALHYEGVDKIYPDHVNALRKAGLAQFNFPTMRYLRSKQGERVDI